MNYSEIKINTIKTINEVLNVADIEEREIIIDKDNFNVICKKFKIETNFRKQYFNMQIFDKNYLNFIVLSNVCFIITNFNNNIMKRIIIGGDENEL